MLRPRRIVAIDYDASIGHRLRSAFPEPDYEFHWFADSREALGRIHGIRPDLIVCDLMLPGIDGRAVLDTVKMSPTLRNVPVLVLSGVRSEAVIRATLDAGAQAYLVKPCPVSKLKRTIDEILDGGDGGGELLVTEEPPAGSERAGAMPDAPARRATDDQPAAPASVPLVSDGRMSRLHLDGRSFQIQTAAEGELDDAVITTIVACDGKELRKAQSRLSFEDPKALKEQLDAQHARAVEATRRLQAEGRFFGKPAQPTDQHAQPAQAAPPLAAAPAGEADQSPAPTDGRKSGRRSRRAEVRVPEPGVAEVARRSARQRGASRRRTPPATLTPGTVFIRPAEWSPVEAKEPAAPEEERLLRVPEPEPEPRRDLELVPPPVLVAPPAALTLTQEEPPQPTASVSLDTVVLETVPEPPAAPEAEAEEHDILTEDGWSPTKRGFWHYIPRAAAAILAVGILAILLEGPSDDDAPQAAASSPEPAAQPAAGSVPASGAPAEPPAQAPGLASSGPVAAAPAPVPTPEPVATPAVPAAAPSAMPSASPAARTGAPSAEAAPATQPAIEPPVSSPSAADRSAAMVRGRLQWAQALYDQGRYDDARAALAEVFKLAPSDARARQLRTRLESAAATAALPTDGGPPAGLVAPASATSAPAEAPSAPAAAAAAPANVAPSLRGSDTALEQDHQAVLALLGRYETAVDHSDVATLKAVWPGVDPEQVLERWKTLKSWQVSLRLIDLAVTGDEGVALCASFDDMVTAEGEKIQDTARLTFHLHRTNGAWLIESLE